MYLGGLTTASGGPSNRGEPTLGHPHRLSRRVIHSVIPVVTLPGLARRPMRAVKWANFEDLWYSRAVQDPTPGAEPTRGTMPKFRKIEAGRRLYANNQLVCDCRMT
jgi:hypothetical protein